MGIYTEPFSANNRHTDRREGFMNYVVEMGSGSMICKPIFGIIGLTIQKFIRATQTTV
jgi:hypothetical protein